MLLLRTKISETMSARDKVLGYTIDWAIDPIIALGCNPNKTLNKIAPSRKAFPNDSLFLIKKSTNINTIKTLIMAGICCKTGILFVRKCCRTFPVLGVGYRGSETQELSPES